MVGADVGDQGSIRALYGEAAAQQAASRRLQDGDLDIAFAEHVAGAARSRPVATIEDAIVDRDPVGGADADGTAAGPQNVLRQPDRRRLAIGSRHDADGDVMKLLPVNRVGDLSGRPRPAARAEAERYEIVVPQQCRTMFRRLVGKPHELDILLLGGSLPDVSERRIEIGRRVTRTERVRARGPCPFVDRRRGVKCIDRRSEREAHAALLATESETRRRPVQRLQHPRDVVHPDRHERVRLGGIAAYIEDRRRFVEQQVRPGQPTRIEEFHETGQSLSSRAMRTPRSSEMISRSAASWKSSDSGRSILTGCFLPPSSARAPALK